MVKVKVNGNKCEFGNDVNGLKKSYFTQIYIQDRSSDQDKSNEAQPTDPLDLYRDQGRRLI